MNPEPWSEMGPELLSALWVIIKLTIAPAAGSLVFGTPLTAICVGPMRILCTLLIRYINVTRNILLTLTVLLASVGFYYNLGLLLAVENDSLIVKQNFCLVVLASVAHTSCLVAESPHVGTNIVPLGQIKAARSLGLGFGQSFCYIIFPQAFRGATIPLGNTLTALIKNVTIASVIGVAEASLPMKTMTENHASDILIIFGIITIGLTILTLSTGLFFGWASKRQAVKY